MNLSELIRLNYTKRKVVTYPDTYRYSTIIPSIIKEKIGVLFVVYDYNYTTKVGYLKAITGITIDEEIIELSDLQDITKYFNLSIEKLNFDVPEITDFSNHHKLIDKYSNIVDDYIFTRDVKFLTEAIPLLSDIEGKSFFDNILIHLLTGD